ncbi:hypothetical protein GCM10009037_27790 [Halarchaeum grantii]|uniref:Uncharacterized protein n=1 Tax=Halarchaeum grantii TaxID=1193105 RepID=A0A830FFR6_9EURY|nr:hypothetical protein [Halarchaeum grantii]GGL42685.1 hypothetical protein GCM10009037_27790 [Halarchaeum grantii]
MLPYIGEALFNEPRGRPLALVQFGASLVFASMFVYAWSGGNADGARWVLFPVVGTSLSGIAESLPETRRRAAGVLRVAGILVLLCLVIAPVAGFEFIIGG